MTIEALSTRALIKPIEGKTMAIGDSKAEKSISTSVSFGKRSEFRGASVASRGNEASFPTGFGSARASIGGDHPTSAEPPATYLGDKKLPELDQVDRLSLLHPESTKKLLDGSKPFKMEDQPSNTNERHTMEAIIRAIKPDQDTKLHYGTYELPQGCDSYNCVLQNTTAGAKMKRILQESCNDNWQLEKIVLQIDPVDKSALRPTEKYQDALPYEVDKYKIIGLFARKN